MAGYIGSKAVTLSTTAADVAGNAVIDGDLTVKGTTVTIDSAAVQEIRLGDNDKMTFGDATGGDLQIYHDGSNSYISDQGTGNLRILADNLYINNAANTQNYISGVSGGALNLFHNGSPKLATTSTGIDVTGTVTADGLTVDGNANLSGTAINFDLDETDTTDLNTRFRQSSGQLFVQTVNDAKSLGYNRLNINHTTGDISFYEDTGTTAKFFWDASAESLGIGTNAPSVPLHINSTATSMARFVGPNGGNLYVTNDSADLITLQAASGDALSFNTNGGNERMRIDSSGNLLVGKTSIGTSTDGFEARAGGITGVSDTSGAALYVNRNGSDGDMVIFQKVGTTVGSIGNLSTRLFIADAGDVAGIKFYNGGIHACGTGGATKDNLHDLGASAARWDDVYATNGTIQTSDQNEKQQIAPLTDAEITAAKAISKLFKTFKWNDSVAEKGDAARTHSGVIAQEVEQAMTEAGLNAGDYAFFISTTWWETQTEVPAVEAVEAQDAVYEDVIIPAVEEVLDEEGNVVTEAQPERTEQRLVSEAVEAVEGKEAYTRTDTYETAEEAPEGATERNRKGIRYPQLLSFIGAATEQRLASIESRLDALEGN